MGNIFEPTFWSNIQIIFYVIFRSFLGQNWPGSSPRKYGKVAKLGYFKAQFFDDELNWFSFGKELFVVPKNWQTVSKNFAKSTFLSKRIKKWSRNEKIEVGKSRWKDIFLKNTSFNSESTFWFEYGVFGRKWLDLRKSKLESADGFEFGKENSNVDSFTKASLGFRNLRVCKPTMNAFDSCGFPWQK